jgi:hypothetical protein
MGKLFQRFRKFPPGDFNGEKKPVIVVSGLPRSGTSLMMMMLEAGGIPPVTDEIRSADEDNPRGYYEFERVKKLREGDFTWVTQAQGKAVKIISALLTNLPSDYTYQVLFMRRAIPEILASQRKMLVNRGEDTEKASDEEMTQYFRKHLAQVENWLLNQTYIKVLYVDYNALLRDPAPIIPEINAFLGGGLDEDKMMAKIDPKLYRQRQS